MTDALTDWKQKYGLTIPLHFALEVSRCKTKQGLKQNLARRGRILPANNHYPLAWCEEVAQREVKRKSSKE